MQANFSISMHDDSPTSWGLNPGHLGMVSSTKVKSISGRQMNRESVWQEVALHHLSFSAAALEGSCVALCGSKLGCRERRNQQNKSVCRQWIRVSGWLWRHHVAWHLLCDWLLSARWLSALPSSPPWSSVQLKRQIVRVWFIKGWAHMWPWMLRCVQVAHSLCPKFHNKMKCRKQRRDWRPSHLSPRWLECGVSGHWTSLVSQLCSRTGRCPSLWRSKWSERCLLGPVCPVTGTWWKLCQSPPPHLWRSAGCCTQSLVSGPDPSTSTGDHGSWCRTCRAEWCCDPPDQRLCCCCCLHRLQETRESGQQKRHSRALLLQVSVSLSDCLVLTENIRQLHLMLLITKRLSP